MTAATMTLADFLLARIAEDVAVAEAASVVPGGDFAVAALPIRLIEQVARFGPRRVLAECAAKRAIVERAACDCCATDQQAEWTMRVLSYPYAEHPDYRSEWRP